MNVPSHCRPAVHFDVALLETAKRHAEELRAAAIDEAISRAVGWPALLWRRLGRVLGRALTRVPGTRVSARETASCRS
jgi:hypothetical protein